MKLLWLLLLPGASLAQIPKNIKVFEPARGQYKPCEPSIAINPMDPSEIVAGAVLDYVFTSTDSGKTWSSDQLESSHGVYGDPCIVSDEHGRFHYFHLSSPSGEGWANEDILDRIVCQRLDSITGAWGDGSAIGFNHPKDQDKEWAVWDPFKKRMVVTWTEFDTYGSKDPKCASHILLSVSTSVSTWSKPIKVSARPGNCIDESATAEGAVPAIGLGGEVYVAWSVDGEIRFRAYDTDLNPRTKSPTIAVDQGANWAFEIPGNGRANGMPVTVCDLSDGPYRGNIYINWADQRNGSDDTDVWMIRSGNGGESWSEPVRVNNDPPGSHQFFTWTAVDQSTGFIYVVFYDRRHHTDMKTDVYLAVSKDGGQTFSNRLISDRPFDPPPASVFFGDYNNISAVDGVIRPIWTRNDKGALSIWTALITERKD